MSKRGVPIGKIIDFAAGRLTREESLALLDQIEHDEHASKDLEMVAVTMDLLEKEGDALSAERATRRESILSRVRSFVGSFFPKIQAHPVLSGAAAFACVLVLLMVMVPASSPYGELASVESFDLGATVRGVEVVDLEVGFNLYREGKYQESIKQFERYLRAFPKGGLLDYAHFSAGAAYLRSSEWRFYSLFIGFDRERVRSGMDHLQEVVRLSGNRRLLEDARWLLAKGDLMLSELEPAMDELRIVEQMGGSRKEEAIGLIQALEKTQQQR